MADAAGAVGTGIGGIAVAVVTGLARIYLSIAAALKGEAVGRTTIIVDIIADGFGNAEYPLKETWNG